MRSTLQLAGVLLVGLLIGGTGLAAADSLPDSAQHVAHTALGRVGIDVPDPERYHGAECGAEAKKNHGAYVRDDHTLAKTDCGKKLKAVEAGESGSDEPKADKGPCSGKPPWAGDKTMTVDEKAAAKAERVAQCGSDDDGESEEPDVEAESDGAKTTETPTTTEAPAPTTEAPATTEAPSDSVPDPSTTTTV